jgi:hypothetical protein
MESATHYITISDWPNHHPWPSAAGMKNHVSKRHINGMDEFGVVKKVAGRILINEAAFMRWVDAEGGESCA